MEPRRCIPSAERQFSWCFLLYWGICAAKVQHELATFPVAGGLSVTRQSISPILSVQKTSLFVQHQIWCSAKMTWHKIHYHSSACSSLDFLQISRAIGVPSIFNTFLFPISGSVNDSRLKAVGVWFQHIDPWNICLREKKKKKKHCWELYSWRGLLKGAICKVTDCWVSFPGHHMLMFWVGDQPELLAQRVGVWQPGNQTQKYKS